MLAAIPQEGKRRSPKKLIRHLLEKPNSTLAESVRNLRTSILFSNLDKPPKVIMVSSSIPGEGKSTTAMLLAIVSKQMGRSAIIVDCDFRRQTLARMFFAGSQTHGLVGLLEDSCTLDEAVLLEPETGLHVLAQGLNETVGGSPADILSSHRFAEMIRELRLRYDLVVLDTPPALVVTDSRVLAGLSDAVVYLVRWGKTNRNAVQEGLRELTSVNARIAGVALTMVSENQAAKYSNNEYYYKRQYKSYLGT